MTIGYQKQCHRDGASPVSGDTPHACMGVPCAEARRRTEVLATRLQRRRRRPPVYAVDPEVDTAVTVATRPARGPGGDRRTCGGTQEDGAALAWRPGRRDDATGHPRTHAHAAPYPDG